MNLPAQHTPPNAFSRFFFAQETPFGLALVRIFLPIACGIPMFMRFRHARELYTADGSPVQMFELFGHSPVLPILPPNIAIPLYSLMLACFVLTVVGFKTRISCLVTTILYLYFNFMDGVGTMTKYSAIASHLLVDTIACWPFVAHDGFLFSAMFGFPFHSAASAPLWAPFSTPYPRRL